MKKVLRSVCFAAALGLALGGLALSACGETEKPSTSHNWSGWEETAATCDEAGARTRHCLDEGCT